MTEWRTDIENAPRDGSTITVRLEGSVRVYWDAELQVWVLNHPLHIEILRDPKEWKHG